METEKEVCPVCGSDFQPEDDFWRINDMKVCADEFCVMRYIMGVANGNT